MKASNLIKALGAFAVGAVVASCVAYEAGRVTLADENWAVDARISESGEFQYLFVSGGVNEEWPKVSVETGTTPDNRPFILITAD